MAGSPAVAATAMLAAVIAVVAAPQGRHHVVRLEPGASGWTETARSRAAVLPDARPVQFDISGGMNDDNGHAAVFGGPDSGRYRHGVLGDDIEPTSLPLLEHHGLEPLAQVDLPAPFLFEDIAPRPIARQGGRGLLTVRSGPQMAVVAARRGHSGQLVLARRGRADRQQPSIPRSRDRIRPVRPREVQLDSPAIALHPLRRDGQPGVAVLQQDGGVAWASVTP